MCGIAGHFAYKSTIRNDFVHAMIEAIRHRGPDAQAFWKERNVSLGHARLSIVDLEAGTQPMMSTDGRFTIVFNGEIYGYKDLRSNLETSYQFRTHSDTEVILAAYAKFGESCVNYLNGMFAFVIYDRIEECLFAARDRFGEKPFFYFDNGQEFLFASEVKALLKSPLVEKKIDLDSLTGYFQSLVVPADGSIFAAVNVLPPGHRLSIKNSRVRVSQYWKIPDKRFKGTYFDAKEMLRNQLKNSIRKQLVADVDVGAFLSGGVDSSAVVCLASLEKKKLSTFSFGFSGDLNELPYADSVASKFGTNHTTVVEKNVDISSSLIELSKIFDEPFADSSNLPMLIICRHARERLKVVLTGDGADELLGGYDWWYQEIAGNVEAKRPINTKAEIRNRYRLFSIEELKKLFPQFVWRTKSIELKTKIRNNPNDLLNQDLLEYMPSDILVKTDRTSMSVGLELRAPFLDRDLVEFVVSLDWNWKFSHGVGKKLLKDAFEDLIPKDILWRKKQGFGAPVGAWLNEEKLNSLFLDIFSSYSRPSELNKKEALNYLKDNTYKKWVLIVYRLWELEWMK